MSQLATLVQSLQQKKSIAIIGMGVSNLPLIHLLVQHNIPLTVRDKSPDVDLQASFEAQGVTFVTGEGYLENLKEDVIFRTPGLSPNTVPLKEAKDNGQQVTSEMQEFFHLCPCPIIAVTGSDGKTTTTTLISEFLKATGKTVFLGGNIGTPLLCQVDQMTKEDLVVLELSSFQLMDLHCDPQVAVITNLAPNHLDYHQDMEEYVSAKTNIFLHQSPHHKVIFNLDNDISNTLAPLTQSNLLYFGRKNTTGAAYLSQDTIYIREKAYLPLDQIQLKGVHNIENFMTAILAVEDFCTPAQVSQVAKTFTGVEHRMQFIRTQDGVSYYNDSIGTSPSRTIAGLLAFQEPIILIAGGYDKGIPFDLLGTEIHRHVKHLLLVGDTATSIQAAVEKASSNDGSTLKTITQYPDLSTTVKAAKALAISGDNVVLSPACAAFDQYKNFAQRGKHFEELVNQLT